MPWWGWLLISLTGALALIFGVIVVYFLNLFSHFLDGW